MIKSQQLHVMQLLSRWTFLLTKGSWEPAEMFGIPDSMLNRETLRLWESLRDVKWTALSRSHGFSFGFSASTSSSALSLSSDWAGSSFWAFEAFFFFLPWGGINSQGRSFTRIKELCYGPSLSLSLSISLPLSPNIKHKRTHTYMPYHTIPLT